MTKFCKTACLTEYFTVDSKAKSLHGLFSDHSLNNSRLFISDGFTSTNGVAQGGILSPRFLNVYIDDLSIAL